MAKIGNLLNVSGPVRARGDGHATVSWRKPEKRFAQDRRARQAIEERALAEASVRIEA
jgi:hypothetical protein